MSHVAFIADAELATVPIHENGEPLVHLADYCPRALFRPSKSAETAGPLVRHQAQFGRIGVATRLAAVEQKLFPQYVLVVSYGYRSPEWQQQVYERMWQRVEAEQPAWTQAQIQEETDTRVAPLSTVPPHTTGGAVDLTLATPAGEMVEMGASPGEFTEFTPLAAAGLAAEIQERRTLLATSLIEAGFVNYPPEWWHWSYGDRYWAAATHAPAALYGTVIWEEHG